MNFPAFVNESRARERQLTSLLMQVHALCQLTIQEVDNLSDVPADITAALNAYDWAAAGVTKAQFQAYITLLRTTLPTNITAIMNKLIPVRI